MRESTIEKIRELKHLYSQTTKRFFTKLKLYDSGLLSLPCIPWVAAQGAILQCLTRQTLRIEWRWERNSIHFRHWCNTFDIYYNSVCVCNDMGTGKKVKIKYPTFLLFFSNLSTITITITIKNLIILKTIKS